MKHPLLTMICDGVSTGRPRLCCYHRVVVSTIVLLLALFSLTASQDCHNEVLSPYLLPCDMDGDVMGSGGGEDNMLTPMMMSCPEPSCISLELQQPNIIVNFGLNCSNPSCEYNYTVEFFPPDSFLPLVDSVTVTLNEDELNQTRFLLAPSLLNEGAESFEMGVVINVTIFLIGSNGISGQIIINGEFAPFVRDLAVLEISNTSIELEWSLLFPTAQPDSYDITYTFTELSGATPIVGNDSITINGNMDSHILTDLLPFTQYNISVAAVYGSASSREVSVVNQTLEGVSGPVANLSVQPDPQTQNFTITWNEPESPAGIIQNYKVLVNSDMPKTINGDSLEFITSFEFFTEYTITVIPVNGFGDGEESTLMVLSPQAAPSAPLNFSLVSNSSTSLLASWTEPTTLNGILTNYTVYCRLSDEQFYPEQEMANFEIQETVTPPTTSAIIEELTEFTRYDCNVTASTDGGESEPSNEDSATTDEDIPTSPADFNVTEYTATSVTIEWSRPATPNGIITEYFIEYTNSSLNQPLTLSIPVVYIRAIDDYNVTNITVYNLNEDTEYTFNISAINGGGIGPSASVIVTTDEAAPSASPENLTGFNTSSTSLFISWDPLPETDRNGVILGYNVTYGSTDDNTRASTTPNTSIELTDLLVYTEYTISVVAFTSVGSGPSSDSITVRTDSAVPEVPRNLTAESKTSTSIEVRWEPPVTFNGPNEGYRLTYVRLETNYTMEINLTVELNLTEVFFNITGLEKYEEYSISVGALSDKGLGETVDITERTDEDLPGVVTALEVDELDSTTILVKWEAPNEPNGIITGYEVEYTTMDKSQNITVDSDELSVELMDLEVFSLYNIRVRAFTSVGPGSYTELVSVRTDPIPSTPPINIMAVPNVQSISLSWTAPEMPNGNIEGYYISTNASTPPNVNVTILESGDGSMAVLNISSDVLNVSSDVLTLMFTGLVPFTSYRFSIAAYSFNHMDNTSNFTILTGQFSNDTISQTLEDAPSAPLNFSLVSSSSTSLLASWIEPMTLNGILTNYTVYCRLSDEQFYPEQEIMANNVKTVTPPTTSAIIEELTEFTRYDCNVTASTDGGESEPSNEDSATTDEDIPTSPADFAVTEYTATSVTIEWSRPATPNGIITEYFIEYTNSSLNQPLTLSIPVVYIRAIDDYNVTNITVYNLNEDTEYTFNISAINGGGIGPSASVIVTTDEAAPSASPENLTGFNTSSTSLFISWDPLPETDRNGVILGYNVTYGSTDDNTRVSTTPNTSIELTNVLVYTDYTISVVAFTSVGSGPSDSITVRTDSAVPEVPRNLTAESKTSTSIEVRWEPPVTFNGPNEGYRLTYVRLETNDTEQLYLTELFHIITGLEKYEEYSISVGALSDKGLGETINIIERTDEDLPGVVTAFEVDELNSTTILVKWEAPNEPNGIITGYEVEYTTMNVSRNITVNSDELSIKLMDLEVFSLYDIRVRAFTDVGPGNYTELASVRTDPGPSTPPINIMAIPNVRSISLSWTAPEMPNGNIEGYYISTNASTPPNVNVTILESGNGGMAVLNISSDVLNVSSDVLTLMFTGLDTFTYYRFSIAAYSFNHMDNTSNFTILTGEFSNDTISQTLEDVPGVVGSFSIDEIDPNTIRVEWKEPSATNGIIILYEVELTKIVNEANVTIMENFTVDDLMPGDGSLYFINLDELEIHTEYGIRVRAFTSAGPGMYTGIMVVRTDPSPASPPTLVDVIALENRMILLSWSEPERPHGFLQGYYIRTNASAINCTLPPAQLTDLSGETVFNVSSETFNLTLCELAPFTYYNVSVAAYSFNFADTTSSFSIIIGQFSDTQIIQTLEEAPSAPLNFSLVSSSSTSLVASWIEPTALNGILTTYTLYCRLSDEQFYPEQEMANFEIQEPVTPTTTSFNITGLLVFTRYSCNVTASTDGGESEPSNEDSATTDEDIPSSPANFTVTEYTATSVTIEWSRPATPNGIITEYFIEYTNSSLTRPLNISIPVVYIRVVNDYNVTNITVYNLNEDTEYTFNISAINGGGTGPSASVIVTTDEAAPSASPENLTGFNTSSTSLFISWDPLPETDRNGVIRGYNVTYSSTDDNTRVSTTLNTSINLTNLLVYTEYTISVVAFTLVGSGPSSDSITVRTDSAVPLAPTMLNATALNSTCINVNWSPPTMIRGIRVEYIVQYELVSADQSYLSTSNPRNVSVSYSSPSLYAILCELHEFAEYNISVGLVNDKGQGDLAIVTSTTLPTAPSGGVRNIAVQAVDSTSVNVSWLPPLLRDWNGIITNYTITFESVDSMLGYVLNGSVMTRSLSNPPTPRAAADLDSLRRESIVIGGLQEAINYTITVVVSNEEGTNPPNLTPPAIQVTTNEDVPSGPPTNVRIDILSSLSANVTWSPPLYVDRNGVITMYQINITSTVTRRLLVSSEVTEPRYMAENLPQFANFSVIVSALTSQGQGPSSAPKFGMTREGLPSAPTNIMLNIDANQRSIEASIVVTWSNPLEPNGIILGYYIFYYGEKDSGLRFDGLNENFTIVINDPTTVSYTITGNLLFDTTYYVNVTAFTRIGNGTSGIGGNISIPTGNPPTLAPNISFEVEIPTDPSTGAVSAVSTSTIPVLFTIPEYLSSNGPIMRVRIICRVFGSTSNNLANYHLSSISSPPNIPPYFAIEVSIDSLQKRGLVKRQENGVMTISETIGTQSGCGVDDEVCNGPLRAGTSYEFKYRAYNSDDDDSYVESPYSPPISTASVASDNSSMVIAIVVVVLLVFVLIVVGVIVVVIIYCKCSKKKQLYSFAGDGTSNLLRNTNGSTKAQLISAGPSIVPLSENVSTKEPAVKSSALKPTPFSRKIYLRDLPGSVSEMISDSGFKFSEEYEKVSSIGLDHSRDASLLPENRAKNRYTNILAYDHSRVKLDYVDDEPGSDYINANFIPGYKVRRAYIATQGPLPSTFDDFWTMVWQQNVHNIVMLTQLVERGRTKCHRYWPGSAVEVYGDITVGMTSEREQEDWVIRVFELTKEKRTRTVHQFQFISWPDHGVPETATSCIDFVSSVHDSIQSMHGPVLVHCSAGVGRTGTFIALGTLLQHIKDHDWVDIFGLACEMRQHRNHMIQTEAQYIFIHKAMVEICQSLSTFSGGKKLPGFNPIYVNSAGTTPEASQQSDFMFGNSLLSEESAQLNKAYDVSKF